MSPCMRHCSILVGLLLLGSCTQRPQPPAVTPPPVMPDVRCPGVNIVFISIDTLRADHLSCYGYKRKTSPVIDQFSTDSLWYTLHMTSMTTTVPAHASMFTGLHPKTHRVLHNGIKLNPDLVTLPELLQEEGYLTAAIVSSYGLDQDVNFDQGFEEFFDVEKFTAASYVLERAVPWIEKNKDRKFFLFLHFWDPHGPHSPPEQYQVWSKGLKSRDKHVANYDGEILYVDETIGKLFDCLKQENLYDSSLIILTADHGELIGDKPNRYWGHGRYQYEQTLRVPLMIRFPTSLGVPPRRIEMLTSVVDLFPTLLNVLEIGFDGPVEGLDLFGEEIRQREYVFAQRQYYGGQDKDVPEDEKPTGEHEYGDKYCIRSLEWKYTWATKYDDELYNLKEDPGEEHNLLEDKGEEGYDVSPLQERIVSWLADRPLDIETDLSVDPEVRKKLQALGYLKGP